MYIVTNRVPVALPWRAQFEERFRTRAGQIDQQPGFVRLQVLRPADAASPYVVLTTWRDKAAFEAWVGSEDFRLAHQHPLPQEAYTGEGPALSTSILLDEQLNRRHMTVMRVSGSCRQFLCETVSRLGVATTTHMLKGLTLRGPQSAPMDHCRCTPAFRASD